MQHGGYGIQIYDGTCHRRKSALVEDDNPAFRAVKTSDIILFITKTDAVHFLTKECTAATFSNFSNKRLSPFSFC